MTWTLNNLDICRCPCRLFGNNPVIKLPEYLAVLLEDVWQFPCHEITWIFAGVLGGCLAMTQSLNYLNIWRCSWRLFGNSPVIKLPGYSLVSLEAV